MHARVPLPTLDYPFLDSFSETVWKIGEGLSARLTGGKRRPNSDFFDPSWPLSESPFGIDPEFPNSFSTHWCENRLSYSHVHGFGVARQGPWFTWVNKSRLKSTFRTMFLQPVQPYLAILFV